MFNTGGNHVLFLALVSDASGFAIAPAAAATPEVIKNALFTEDENTSNGGLTFDVDTGVVTVAKEQGKGKYLCRISAGNTVGQQSGFHTLQVYASEAGVAAAAVGPKTRKDEPATAEQGALQQTAGAIECVVNLSAIGDTAEIRLGVQTNADSVTIRDLSFSMLKIGEVNA